MSPKDLIHHFFVIFLSTELFSNAQSLTETKREYLAKRKDLMNEEYILRPGSSITLTAAEEMANNVLMSAKTSEIYDSREGGVKFTPSLHFFKAKSTILQSIVFKILRTMPKGAVLHVHDSAMVDIQWLIKKATYLPNCYMCYNTTQLYFHFFEKPPQRRYDCKWQNVTYLRSKSRDIRQFDKWLHDNMTLVVSDPYRAYPTQTVVWKKFQSIFNVVSGLIFYAPVFKAYYQRALEIFYDDNVLYLEVRAMLPPVYELDGTIHDRRWVMKTYREISEAFQKTHPDFMGSKIIFTSSRGSSRRTIEDDVQQAMKLRADMPDFMAGYDLVGHEDSGHPLLYFNEELLGPSQAVPPVKLPFFFHAGETNWSLQDVDDNLIDAVLLNTSRIGHGFALTKHPKVMDIIRKRDIAVEVNPISNQVLGLVDDLRNHPAAELLASGVPVVVSCDDPALWGATGVSFDWYELFMGIAGFKDDLRLLKKLSMDSIRYSSMSGAEKSKAMLIWQEKWKIFIHRAMKRGYE